jgi:hypothetical protein
MLVEGQVHSGVVQNYWAGARRVVYDERSTSTASLDCDAALALRILPMVYFDANDTGLYNYMGMKGCGERARLVLAAI